MNEIKGVRTYCGIKWIFGYFLVCMINKKIEQKMQSPKQYLSWNYPI